MKLIEKFEEVEYSDFDGLVKIVDEFAIGFAEWIDCVYYQGDDFNEYHKSTMEYREGKVFTARQLLEIYKKEKGL